MTFSEKLAEKPNGELLRVMSNIRRRASRRDNVNGLRSTNDDLEAYADYFSEIFARIVLGGRTLNAIISGLLNNKVPGVDGITAEVVKLGEEALVVPYIGVDASQRKGT